MKARTGVAADSALVHSLCVTAATVSDPSQTHRWPHGREQRVHGDAGYRGIETRKEIHTAQAEGAIRTDIQWFIAAQRSPVNVTADDTLKTLTRALERRKAQIRAHCLRKPDTTKTRQVAFFQGKREDSHTDRMKVMIDADLGKQMIAARFATVEPVFGNLRHNKRLSRFT